jgi:hypothetical protein
VTLEARLRSELLLLVKEEFMNLTEQQLDDATAGKPVRLEIPGRGIFFLVNVGFFEKIQKVRSKSSERDPELEAFLDLAEEEADRIATENPY